MSNRFDLLFGMLSASQRAALGLVQSSLKEDPTCLDKPHILGKDVDLIITDDIEEGEENA